MTPSTTTFTDRCIACHRIFISHWGDRTSYCSSSCNLALLTIREGFYLSPSFHGGQVKFIIQTCEHPSPANEAETWLAYTDPPADLASRVLGVYPGAGQFAAEGGSELEAVLNLIESIEENS